MEILIAMFALAIVAGLVFGIVRTKIKPPRDTGPATPPVPEGQYRWTSMGAEIGPFSSAELKSAVQERRVNPQTQLTFNGSAAFSAAEVPGLFIQEGAKSFTTAIVLSVLLGSLGVDRFYLGYPVLGLLKLVTFGGCGLWALVDLILIATGKVTAADGTALQR